ncbi:MAG: hypothetical protein ETSY1_39375 [Candidatus Entotheonella factor]|uniref:Zinc finger/thioredoxin putative domain-containing protein n=1 Tax=Entotheonella factor TaxID=1429438 RepID=W4L5T1_ENTF1|nr:MAG: hypothetical protein ETSY1_39375 [Candidatus Entotheonella factor]
MQIACPTCDKRLQIADEKLPTDRKVRITCPACQENFTYNPDGTALLSVVPRTETPPQPESAPSEPTTNQPTADPVETPPAKSAALPVPTLNLDVLEAGPPPRVLVCVDDAAQRRDYDEILATLGFSTVHIMEEQVQAMTYLTQVAYDVVILDAKFDGSTLEANPVLACVSEIPMEQRRRMYVAVCADEKYTYDAIGAYSQGVNLFFSYTDGREALRTLEHGMADHKRLYRIYWDVCQELGKE